VPGKVELTVTMTRIMFPFLLLVSLAALAMGILNSRNIFAIPASASTFFNIGSIMGGLFCAYLIDPALGPRSIIGMAVGTVIGGLMQYLVQVPSLYRAGYRYEATVSLSDPGVRRILTLIGPAIIGLAAVQVNILVNSYFASFLGNGPVSWLNYAFRLMQFPIGLFGVAIATVTFPSISRSAALNNAHELKDTISGSLGMVFLFCIPSAFGLAFLSRPIIAIIYEHGRFTPDDTMQTAAALSCYSAGLIGYAAIKVVSPAFFALNKPRIPMMISLGSMITNFVLNYLFTQVLFWGHKGLALTTSAVAIVNFILLVIFLRKQIGELHGNLYASFGRIVAASAVMTGVCCAVLAGMEHFFQGRAFAVRLISLSASLLVGAAVFYAACRLLGVVELKRATDAFLGRFLRKKK
jgi:putative peptidoglycan lipid II flippase